MNEWEDNSNNPGGSEASSGSALSDIEQEIIALLWMSAERVEELADMFVAEDRQQLADVGPTVQDGLVLYLDNLANLGLVSRVCPGPSSDTWWHLTEKGIMTAKSITKKYQ